MKTVTVIETFDGARHENIKRATHYLEVAYSNELHELSHQIIPLVHRTAAEYVDANLVDLGARLDRLRQIRADLDIAKDPKAEIPSDDEW